MHQYWQVHVHANNETLVSIGNNWLSGLRDLSEKDENTIVGAAQHLLSFMGYGLPTPSHSPDLESKPTGWVWPGESGLVFTEDAEKADAARILGLQVSAVYKPVIQAEEVPF